MSPRNIDGNFILLFVGSSKCQETYPKTRKVKGFYEALTMEKKDILGTPPPRAVQERFNVWSQAVKKQGKWTLDAIAESIYIIACHVHDHQEKLLAKGERVSTGSKIIVLILMYSSFITKINLVEAVCQLQKKAAAMNLQQQQQKQKSTKPLPPNFQYGASNVCILFLC
jgi:hypothetical protein